MFKVNEDYLKLRGSYLFSNIGKKVAAYKEANPDKSIISLGIGDVTKPIVPACIKAMQKAVEEMGTKGNEYSKSHHIPNCNHSNLQ